MAPRLLACSHDFNALRLRTAASRALVILAADGPAAVLCSLALVALVEQFKLSNVYKRSMRSMAGTKKVEMQSLEARCAFEACASA